MFDEDCVVRFVHALMTGIVEVMTLSILLTANSRAAYIRYNRGGEMRITHQSVLFFVDFGKDATVTSTFRSAQLEDPSLYNISEKDILIIIRDTDAFV